MDKILGGVGTGRDVQPNSPVVAIPNVANSKSYGTGYVGLFPSGGDAATSGRTGIAIHSGGNSSFVPQPYDDHIQLINTYGCIRMCNSDVNELIQKITNLEVTDKFHADTLDFKRTDVQFEFKEEHLKREK